MDHPLSRESSGPAAGATAGQHDLRDLRWQRGERAVAVAIVGFFAGAIVPMAGFRPEARILPLIIAVPGLLLALSNLVRVWRRSVVPAAEEPTEASVGAAAAWVLLDGVLVILFGLMVGSVIFIPLFMVLYGRQRLIVVVLVTVSVLVLVYFGLINTLNVPYWRGLLP